MPTATEILKEVSVPKHQCLHLSPAQLNSELRAMEYDISSAKDEKFENLAEETIESQTL